MTEKELEEMERRVDGALTAGGGYTDGWNALQEIIAEVRRLRALLSTLGLDLATADEAVVVNGKVTKWGNLSQKDIEKMPTFWWRKDGKHEP